MTDKRKLPRTPAGYIDYDRMIVDAMDDGKVEDEITALRAERDELKTRLERAIRSGNVACEIADAKDVEVKRLTAECDAAIISAKVKDTIIERMTNQLAESDKRLADWQSSQTYRYIGRDGKPILARDLESRAEAAEAEINRLKGLAHEMLEGGAE